MSSEQAQNPEAKKAFGEEMLEKGNHRKETAKAIIEAMGFKYEETGAK